MLLDTRVATGSLQPGTDHPGLSASTRASRVTMLSERGRRLSPEAISVRIANCEADFEMASELVNRTYDWQGYGSDHRIPDDAHCVTFTALEQNELIGTLTLAVDTPAGLGVDQTFQVEMKVIRSSGSKCCELTKFAFDPMSTSKQVLARFFHAIFIYGSRRYDCTDLVIEVNPKHVHFYETMLGFRQLGAVKNNAAVNAPSQLLWLSVSEIRHQINIHASNAVAAGRSLYPFFASPDEEDRIYARLAQRSTPHARPHCAPLEEFQKLANAA